MMKKTKRVLAGIFAASIAFTANGFLYGANATSLNDEFVIPGLIDKTGYVGEKMELARVMPTDDAAENYNFTVLNSQNEKVETDGYSFLPKAAGEYKCLYSYTLGGRTYEYNYIVVATIKDGPVFANRPVFPNAFIAGKNYKLPTVDAADYTSGSAVKADVSVSVTCGGTSVPVTDGVFVPVYTNQTDKAEIVYTATSGNKSETLKVNVPIVRVTDENGKLSMTELFSRKGFEKVQATNDKLTFTTTGNAEASFANKLIADTLDLEFGFGENDQAESIVVTLQSYEDPSVEVSVEFKKGKISSGVGSVILNGKTEKAYTYTKGETLCLGFKAATNRLLGVGNEFLFDVLQDAKGGEFTGFPGGLVKVGIEVKNTYGTCDLDIVKFNQYLTDAENEQVAPLLYMEEQSSEYAVGDVVTLPKAYAIDVINPNAEVRVTVQKGLDIVKDLSGDEIKDVLVEDEKDISFKADRSGNYQVVYTMIDPSAFDVNGDPITTSQTKPIRAYDYEAPTISVDGKIKSSVKVGDTITIPKITVSDNDGGKLSMLQVCMIRPTGYIDALTDNLSSSGTPVKDTVDTVNYKFTMAGTYRLRLMATDQYGNYEKIDYVIKCGG